jgi:FkbM family methyltransferase
MHTFWQGRGTKLNFLTPKIILSKVLSNLMLIEGAVKWVGKNDYTILPNGKILTFNRWDKTNVYGYVTTIWKYNVYGDVCSDKPVVDAGASVGTYSLKVADDVESVIAFEPEPLIHKKLTENITLNKISNIFPIAVALSNYDGVSDFYITRQLLGEGHDITPRHIPKEKFKVTCMKLDTAMEMFFPKIREIGTLKADVEGHEIHMLLGSRSLLERGAIENLSLAVYHYQNEEEDVRKFLERYGYKTMTRFFLNGDIILYARLVR